MHSIVEPAPRLPQPSQPGRGGVLPYGRGATPDVVMPRPRTPLADSLRRLFPPPDAGPRLDLDRVCGDLARVAVRTSPVGAWQEHATFLLGTHSGHWHLVPFTDPVASELIPRLRALPGFNPDLLLELIGSRTGRIVMLWDARG